MQKANGSEKSGGSGALDFFKEGFLNTVQGLGPGFEAKLVSDGCFCSGLLSDAESKVFLGAGQRGLIIRREFP